MANNSVTRLPSGITNVTESSIFADMLQPVPSLYQSYINDFFSYAAADWTVTATGSTTQALTAGNAGLLLMTNSAGASDLMALQKLPGMITLNQAKKTFFSSIFQASDVTLSTIVMGLQVVTATPLTATQGIYFIKPTAAAAVSIVSRFNATTGSTSVTNIATMVNATNIQLDWYYNGNNTLYYAVNGVLSGSIDVTNFFPTANLTVSLALQNSSAVAKTMTVDNILVMQER